MGCRSGHIRTIRLVATVNGRGMGLLLEEFLCMFETHRVVIFSCINGHNYVTPHEWMECKDLLRVESAKRHIKIPHWHTGEMQSIQWLLRTMLGILTCSNTNIQMEVSQRMQKVEKKMGDWMWLPSISRNLVGLRFEQKKRWGWRQCNTNPLPHK